LRLTLVKKASAITLSALLLSMLCPNNSLAATFLVVGRDASATVFIDVSQIPRASDGIVKFTKNSVLSNPVRTRTGKVGQIGRFSVEMDCQRSYYRETSIDIYALDGVLVDYIPKISPWRVVTDALHAKDDEDLFCGKRSPSVHAQFQARDWREAAAMLISAGKRPRRIS